ncbi:MAG: hypothetical protein WCA04_10205 [Geobacteraceae bacterium]
MLHFYRNSLIFLFIVIPVSASARSNKDADAIITMRNGQPCFSYPQYEEIQKKPYSFDYLSVSKNGPVGGVGWEISIKDYDRKGLLEPNSPETCIEYGVLNPGMKEKQAAKPLQSDTPYQVFISVSEAPGGRNSYGRKFAADFCISRNEKGEPILVGASGGGTGDWRCLKPGESKNRGFWQRLFGK